MISYRTFGTSIDQAAHAQMQNACSLPVSVAAALMPDAHVGYGLPIGGVLATRDAVIPYAVGVDIGCRVMLTITDQPITDIAYKMKQLVQVVEDNTRFGIGAAWKRPLEHPVMEEDWRFSSVVSSLKDTAHKQLGTSGSGNHFVEIGELTLNADRSGLKRGRYSAIVSHSGSRGAGARIADHYSKLAASLHPELPKELQHLAWLSMSGEGAEYWAAMELMGRYSSANHLLIHERILSALGAKQLWRVENHHNFAWREIINGEELIVHRKGATPAGKGVVGYVPGTMVAPGYIVEGKGELVALNSCSHGAGRAMSRNQARRSFSRRDLTEITTRHGVKVISCGLDEVPQAYKDIQQVMSEQSSLVDIIGTFQPKIVKMAPEGERPED